MSKKIKDGRHFDSYSEVVEYLEKEKRNMHLLLGNGFSIAYNPSIFSYNALKEYIELKGNQDISKLFEVTKTSNFEVVMQALDNYISLGHALNFNEADIDKCMNLKEELKKELIDAIDKMHPDCIFKLTDENINYCGKFLEPYFKDECSIISTNYDLLLYWVLMRYQSTDGRSFSDGFSHKYEKEIRTVKGYTQVDKSLIWNGSQSQNIFYLHGALHIFDTRHGYEKEQYDADQHCFIKNRIDSRIKKDNYPVFVTAGDSSQKMQQIMHNGYLAYCYNHLKIIRGSLVTLGFSFGENDKHIIDAINEAGKKGLNSIYIGCFSDSDSQYIKELIDQKYFNVKVNTYDAKTAHIWH